MPALQALPKVDGEDELLQYRPRRRKRFVVVTGLTHLCHIAKAMKDIEDTDFDIVISDLGIDPDGLLELLEGADGCIIDLGHFPRMEEALFEAAIVQLADRTGVVCMHDFLRALKLLRSRAVSFLALSDEAPDFPHARTTHRVPNPLQNFDEILRLFASAVQTTPG